MFCCSVEGQPLVGVYSRSSALAWLQPGRDSLGGPGERRVPHRQLEEGVRVVGSEEVESADELWEAEPRHEVRLRHSPTPVCVTSHSRKPSTPTVRVRWCLRVVFCASVYLLTYEFTGIFLLLIFSTFFPPSVLQANNHWTRQEDIFLFPFHFILSI